MPPGVPRNSRRRVARAGAPGGGQRHGLFAPHRRRGIPAPRLFRDLRRRSRGWASSSPCSPTARSSPRRWQSAWRRPRPAAPKSPSTAPPPPLTRPSPASPAVTPAAAPASRHWSNTVSRLDSRPQSPGKTWANWKRCGRWRTTGACRSRRAGCSPNGATARYRRWPIAACRPAECVALEATDRASATEWTEAAMRESSLGHDRNFYCQAGQAAFVVNPLGEMNVCLDLPLPAARPLEIGFRAAWEQVQRYVDSAPPLAAALPGLRGARLLPALPGLVALGNRHVDRTRALSV